MSEGLPIEADLHKGHQAARAGSYLRPYLRSPMGTTGPANGSPPCRCNPRSPLRSEGGVEAVETLIESADGAGAVLGTACGAAQGRGQTPVRLLEDQLGERPGPGASPCSSVSWRAVCGGLGSLIA